MLTHTPGREAEYLQDVVHMGLLNIDRIVAHLSEQDEGNENGTSYIDMNNAIQDCSVNYKDSETKNRIEELEDNF